MAGNYQTAPEPQGEVPDGHHFPQGPPEPELVWGQWELQGLVRLSLCWFSTGYFDKGVQEATGWVSRLFWHRLCHAGLGYTSQQQC